ncbi:MAG: phenylacetate--CoA ligase family protein [Candidatus Kapabacteria bacterium]|nr:phenylacetate--CoA ligase family protein [Candidatus Kapabacteria bacterium]
MKGFAGKQKKPMFRKAIFKLAHFAAAPDFWKVYRRVMENQWRPYEELKAEQDEQLRKMILFAYENVPYYNKLFNKLGIIPSDIQRSEDLQILPILTKEIIKENWNEFIPKNLDKMKYDNRATGGSTGTPLKYRVSKEQRVMAGCLLYRGWSYGGYEPGDSMVFLAGSSLGANAKTKLGKLIHETARNLKKLSSFDMSEKEMMEYVEIINHFKPKFIRGYASSIYFFSEWIINNNIHIHKPVSIFTTSEKLHNFMRPIISKAFNCDVFDGYGLFDGGISANECNHHSGLHIDTEGAVMEIVEENAKQIINGEGNVLATSLYNYALPFIRYDTGDIATISDEKCDCGRNFKLLKDIVGRSVDYLITPEGKHIHGWFFLYIFWQYCQGIKHYQVIQNTIDTVNIKIVKDHSFENSQISKILDAVRLRSENWKVEFEFVDKIERTGAGKFKFIINNLNKRNDQS